MKRSPAAHLMDGNGPAGWPKPPPAHGQSCHAATTGCRHTVPWLWGQQSCHGSLGDVHEGHLGRANSMGPQGLQLCPPAYPSVLCAVVLLLCRRLMVT